MKYAYCCSTARRGEIDPLAPRANNTWNLSGIEDFARCAAIEQWMSVGGDGIDPQLLSRAIQIASPSGARGIFLLVERVDGCNATALGA